MWPLVLAAVLTYSASGPSVRFCSRCILMTMMMMMIMLLLILCTLRTFHSFAFLRCLHFFTILHFITKPLNKIQSEWASSKVFDERLWLCPGLWAREKEKGKDLNGGWAFGDRILAGLGQCGLGRHSKICEVVQLLQCCCIANKAAPSTPSEIVLLSWFILLFFGPLLPQKVLSCCYCCCCRCCCRKLQLQAAVSCPARKQAPIVEEVPEVATSDGVKTVA